MNMFCTNCGAQNSDTAKFCVKCGTPLQTNASAQVQETPPAQPVENVQQVPTVQPVPAVQQVPNAQPVSTVQQVPTNGSVPVYQPNQPVNTSIPTPPIAPNIPKKKKGGKIVVFFLLTIIIVAVVGAVVVFGKDLIMPKSPEQKLVNAMDKMEDIKSMEIYGKMYIKDFQMGEMDAESVDSAMVKNIISDFSIQYTIKKSDTDKMAEGTVGIFMKETELLTADFFMNNDYLAINSPQAYDQTIYISFEDLATKLSEQEDGVAVNMSYDQLLKYKNAMDKDELKAYKKFDEKKYKDMIAEFLKEIETGVSSEEVTLTLGENEEKVKGKQYVLDYENEAVVAFMATILDELVNDEALRPVIYEIVDQVIAQIVKDEDVGMYNVIASMMEEDAIEEWDSDSEDDLVSMSDDMKDELDTGLDDAADSMTTFEEDTNSSLGDATIAGTSTILLDGKGFVRMVNNDFTLNNLTDTTLPSLDTLGLPGTLGDDLSQVPSTSDLGISISQMVIASEISVSNINGKIDFNELSTDDGVDLGGMSEEEMTALMDEISTNLGEILMSSDLMGTPEITE